MDSNRQTKDFETTGGKKLTLVSYASGRECNEIDNVFLEGTTTSLTGGMSRVEGISAEASEKQKKKKIELLVVALDGDSKNLVDRVLDLPKDDYYEVMAQLDELTKKKQPTKTPQR